jgi:protein gp37
MTTTTIEWTEKSWNPVRGCSVISAGCTHCYAMRVAHRFSGPGGRYEGLTRARKSLGPVWTGDVRFVPEKLAEPLSWRAPTRIFVNSMSDLFHEGVSDEQIAAVFGVMAAAPRHTFQVLTKRPERARAWFAWIADQGEELLAAVGEEPPGGSPIPAACASFLPMVTGGNVADSSEWLGRDAWRAAMRAPWALPNVWLGASVEDQKTADERIPILLELPAAVRWVSYEPALGSVDWKNIASARDEMMLPLAGLTWSIGSPPRVVRTHPKLDWIVVGGESGPGARPFDVAWARSTVEQCRAAGVPVFVKQLGACPHWSYAPPPPQWTERRRDRKGGEPSEWPEDLRVREYPEARG